MLLHVLVAYPFLLLCSIPCMDSSHLVYPFSWWWVFGCFQFGRHYEESFLKQNNNKRNTSQKKHLLISKGNGVNFSEEARQTPL